MSGVLTKSAKETTFLTPFYLSRFKVKIGSKKSSILPEVRFIPGLTIKKQ
jgi:hypothetical protein